MKIIVGLGNPGPKYETTRHNVGFLAADRLVDEWKATGPKVQYESEIFTTKVGGEPVLIVKPQTFMNLSGRGVAPLATFYKCAPSDVIVIHDEVDLKPLALRIKSGGGSGGHNGLKSMDESLGSNEYHRLRIGVGHPRVFNPQMDTADYVLSPFTDGELQGLDVLFDQVVKALTLMIDGQVLKAMTLYNRAE